MSLRLEPAPILDLAQWMRDGTWLDMRTPMGRAVRVRITSLMVTRDADELAIEQQWVDEHDRRKNRYFSFDAEGVWDCAPTTVGLLDVVPLVGRSAPDRPSESQVAAHIQEVADSVFDALCVMFGYLDRKALLGEVVGNSYETFHRHQAIIAIYEMADVSPRDICTKLLNYTSPQPWVTACWKCRANTDEARGMRRTIERVDALVEARMGSKQRRTGPFPQDYKPVLK